MAESRTIELLCQLSHASNLQQICDLSYHVTGNPVFISDMAHTILAYTKAVEIHDETWQTNIVHAQLNRNIMNQNREVNSVHMTSEIEKRPVVVMDDYLPYPHIIKTLVQDHKPIGVLVLTSCLKPLREQDTHLVELISSFVIACLKRERFHISDNRNAVENYFIKLLDGESYPREQIDKRLDILDYHQKPYTYVLALCNDENTSSRGEGVLSQIRTELSSTLRCQVLLYNSLLICIYGSDKPVKRWPDDVPGMADMLSKLGLLCGVSRQLPHMEKLRERYLQAHAVMEKGRRLARRQRCYHFDSMSSFLLLDRIPVAELDNFCHEQIQRLWAYDLSHGTELCATLQVYLEQAKSLSKTAELLFVHRNTVRYRIKRCMELLDNNLDDGNEIFAYILSLRIREYRTKLCGEHNEFTALRSPVPQGTETES